MAQRSAREMAGWLSFPQIRANAEGTPKKGPETVQSALRVAPATHRSLVDHVWTLFEPCWAVDTSGTLDQIGPAFDQIWVVSAAIDLIWARFGRSRPARIGRLRANSATFCATVAKLGPLLGNCCLQSAKIGRVRPNWSRFGSNLAEIRRTSGDSGRIGPDVAQIRPGVGRRRGNFAEAHRGCANFGTDSFIFARRFWQRFAKIGPDVEAIVVRSRRQSCPNCPSGRDDPQHAS